MSRRHRSYDHFPKNWPLARKFFDLGYPAWEERHGGWSKREVIELADPIDEEDPYPWYEQDADGEVVPDELEASF